MDRRWSRNTSYWALAVLLAVFTAGCGLFPVMSSGRTAEETLSAIRGEETSLAIQRGMLTQQVLYSTRQAPTSTATPELSPTPEPEASPTAETTPTLPAVVRPGSDPALQYGDPHDSDHFDGDSGAFLASDDGASRAIREDGTFRLEFDSRGRWTWYWSFVDAGNFYAEVLITQGEQCVEGDSAGLLFRGNASRDEAYIFGISCAGDYFIGITSSPGTEGAICALRNGGEVDCGFRYWQSADVILAGPGSVNRLGVYAEDTHIDYYINGVWIASRELSTLYSEWRYLRGNLALYLASGQVGGAVAGFDYFNLWYFD